MDKTTQIELLAPARNADYGIEAINHGADAVYIGAPNFGARKAAGNQISDIVPLIDYAHLFSAKVYATLNTILFDDELSEAQSIIGNLYNAGIDGLIIQDMGILEMNNLPPVPLIASTQMHNTTVEKIMFLEKIGFKRVILARELSLKDIFDIRAATSVELEAFVHGALCVSYSGQCYMSQAICGRSGNRGVCAQPCRSAYNLIDRNGNKIVSNKYLLSLKDLNLSRHLGRMLDAGVTSFKIEGRLKDIAYLKNVVSFYRKELDRIIEQKPNFRKSSSGYIMSGFVPDLDKSFNRGYTSYFIDGRKEKTGSFDSQKSIGEPIGKVITAGNRWVIIDGKKLSKGDGICFFDIHGVLNGTLINNTDQDKVYPKDMQGLICETAIFRNHDHEFEKELKRGTAQRKIGITMLFEEWEQGFGLRVTDDDGFTAGVNIECPKIPAGKIDAANGQIIGQLGKLGDTVFEAKEKRITVTGQYFVPARIVNQLRRDAIARLAETRLRQYTAERIVFKPNNIAWYKNKATFHDNIANRLAAQFYKRHGVQKSEEAFELQTDYRDKVLMMSKHCIRYQLNACKYFQHEDTILNEPLYLKDYHHTYRLEFDCKNCVMKVIFEK